MSTERTLYRRALEASARGDARLALRTMRRLVLLCPRVAIYHALLADESHRQDHLAGAIDQYRAALALLQDDGRPQQPAICGCRLKGEVPLRMALGSALHAAGDTAGAESEVRRAIEQDPSADRWVELAYLLEAQGRPAQARRCYLHALGLSRENVRALGGLAFLDVWHRPDRAERRLRRALRHDPDHIEILTSLAFVCLGDQRLDEAEALLARACGGSERARPFVYLGYVYEQQGRTVDAMAMLQRAERLDPGDPHPLFAQGDLHQREGRLEQARIRYLDAIVLAPDSADAWLRLGLLLHVMESSDPMEARDALQQGLALAPQHPWRPWIESDVLPELLAGDIGEPCA